MSVMMFVYRVRILCLLNLHAINVICRATQLTSVIPGIMIMWVVRARLDLIQYVVKLHYADYYGYVYTCLEGKWWWALTTNCFRRCLIELHPIMLLNHYPRYGFSDYLCVPVRCSRMCTVVASSVQRRLCVTSHSL